MTTPLAPAAPGGSASAGPRAEPTLGAFLAKKWYYVVFLVGFTVARFGFEASLNEVLPDLLLNAIYIVEVLGLLFFFVRSYLKTFGTPVSFGLAQPHKQSIAIVSDEQIDGVRGVLTAYVDEGRYDESYRQLVRSIATQLQGNSTTVDPFLESLPPPTAPQEPAARPGPVLASALALALAAGCSLATAFFNRLDLWIMFTVACSAFFTPVFHVFMRGDTDTTHPGVWFAAALVGLPNALLLFATIDSSLLFLGGILYAPHLLAGVLAIKTYRTKRAESPLVAKLHAADRTAKMARGNRTLAIVLASLLLLYSSARYLGEGFVPEAERGAFKTKVLPLPYALVVSVLLLAAALLLSWYLLGPAQGDQRDRLRRLHEEEQRRRRAHHFRIIDLLEQHVGI